MKQLPRSRFRWKQLGTGLLFVSPWLIGFAAFVIYPLVYNIYLGFTEFSGFGEPTWIGTDNYERLVRDDLFWRSLYNTLYYTLLAVPIGVVAALVLALGHELADQRDADLPSGDRTTVGATGVRALVCIYLAT
ncbi:MAG: sugar ABC transporter permease [Trueperaceae bacterium]|nr:sugar ABC transporter permease [Trueperaceae bacterium]